MSEVRVVREDLLRVLETVRPGLSSQRETVEQSSCFAFSGGSVFAYNDEVLCRATSPLGDVEGAVKGDTFLELLRKLPDEHLAVEAKNGTLRVAGAGREAKLRLEHEMAAHWEGIEHPAKGDWRDLPEGFAEAVGVVVDCAGDDESQFHLTCVHIHTKWLEACDDVQLCRWPLKTGLKEPALVRHTALRHIPALGVVKLAETAGWLHFRGSGITMSCRRYVEQYDDLGPFLKVADAVPVPLPKGLAEAAEIAALFASESGDGHKVRVSLSPGKVVVSGEGVTGRYRERRKAAYSGRPLSFLIAPALLQDLVKRHEEFLIAPERLKVEGRGYTYVTALTAPEAPQAATTEEA